MHEAIRRFEIEGSLRDNDIPRLRPHFENLLRQNMRDSGYVPVLDLDTQWSTDYLESADQYFFVLSMYGIRVGKGNAWTIEGISDGQKIMRTPQTKSRPPSLQSE